MFKEFLRKYEKNSIWISVLMLILSIFIIFAPIKSILTIIYMFSIFVLIDGIMHIVSYFKTDKENRLMNFEFSEGILDILFSVLIFFSASYLVPFITGLI